MAERRINHRRAIRRALERTMQSGVREVHQGPD